MVADQMYRSSGPAEGSYQPLAKAALQKLHERFVADPTGTDLSELRPVIARSWLRSQACNVSPSLTSLDVTRDPQLDEHVLRCAEPVLRDLEQICADTGGCVSLADPNGTLTVCRGDTSLVRWIDGMFPISGASMLEEVTGTNSEGTALEEGFGVQVWGAEHFTNVLQDACCTTVPIRDPLRQSIRGLLSLMLPERIAAYSDARSIGLIVHGAAAEVSRALAAHLAAREQALLTAYMREIRKRGTDVVVAMDDRTTIATQAAMKVLDQQDYAVLAGYGREATQRRAPIKRELIVGDLRAFDLLASPITVEDHAAGCVFRLRPSAPGADRAPKRAGTQRNDPFPSLVGESPALRRALAAASTALRRRLPVHIVGEAGTGKLHLAQEIAEELWEQAETVTCDGNGVTRDEVERLGVSILSGEAVILHHVDTLEGELRDALSEFVYGTDQPAVIITSCRLRDDVLGLVKAVRGIEVQMPPLRRRREDIPLLAAHFVQASPGAPDHVSGRLLGILAEADWPGNVRQLREVMERAASQAAGSEVGIDDLTMRDRNVVARRPLSRLEDAELQQIRDALVEARGNRVKAAAILQIGRSTLYRKMDMYARRGFELTHGE